MTATPSGNGGGRFPLRQAVRERNGGRQRSVFVDLEVPEFSNRLAMSGVLLTSNRATAVPTSVDRDIHERLAVLPSVRRTFSPDDELIAAAEVYDSSRGRDIDLLTTVIDAAGRECYRRVTKVARNDFRAADGAYRHAVQIPLKGASGDLILVIEARPIASSGETVTRRVAVAVTPH